MELRELFSEIAGAVRERDGSAGNIAALDFPERIRALPQGSGIDLQSLRITAPPSKTVYYRNCFGAEAFVSAGMTLEAAVGDGSRSFAFPVGVSAVEFSPSGPLPSGTGTVTVTFHFGRGEASAAQAVSVQHKTATWTELEAGCANWTALETLARTWSELWD